MKLNLDKSQKIISCRIIFTILSLVLLNILPITGVIKLVCFVIVFLIIGYDIIKEAIEGILKGYVFDENFLMSIATIGAFGIAIYKKDGDYNEAIAVMLFFQIGEFFQSYAVNRSKKNIKKLMDIRPDYANIEKDDKLIKVDPASVAKGSVITVNPGEKVPLDGFVVEGSTSLNTAALTGESVPRDVSVGDDVISGCINLNGVIKVQTTKTFKQSTVSKILDLVENSQNRKSKSENFIKKFAKVYTPIVCALALIIAVVVPVVSIFILNVNTDWFTWIYRALTFLVISCPCALVIGIPLSFFAGIGGASREGVLIKGSTFIEVLSKLKYIAFDKTGTLTKGVFKVITVHHNTMPKSKLIEYAAYAESASTHPIALSILSAYGKEIKASRVCEINQTAGKGISAKVDGKTVLAGNSKFMEANNVEYSECSYAGTIVHVAIDGVYEGHIVISDELKPNSKAAIEELKKLHVKKIVMLTGDSPKVAQQVAESLNIDEYYAGLLPDDKVAKLEELKSNKSSGEMLGFVGDGINDAPVLAIADVGVAMGGVGSDAALEAADVVLMNDEPKQIAKAIKISNKCMRIVRENIVFAIGVKVICLILGAVGIADMWLAIFADVGVMIICVLNAIRALRVHKL